MNQLWNVFGGTKWKKNVDVRDFIQNNYLPYEGDSSFLVSTTTERTKKLFDKVLDLMAEERDKGILDAETTIPSTVSAYKAGYIDKDLETIVGIQTDKPLKRAIMPKGGIRIVRNALESYGYEIDPNTNETFAHHAKTHNDGVFDAYTTGMRKARHSGIITGLPDSYGRGRIIGDYRRVALYGVDHLINEKEQAKSIWKSSLWTKILSYCVKKYLNKSAH